MRVKVSLTHQLCCICENGNIIFIRKPKRTKIKIRVLGSISYISIKEYINNRDKYEMFVIDD